MLLELKEVLELIDKEMEFARMINAHMALGMSKAKDIIENAENKKVEFINSLTSVEEQFKQWERDPD